MAAAPAVLGAQQTDTTAKMDTTVTSSPTTAPTPTAPASAASTTPAPNTPTSGPDFSGTVFANYQYLTGKAGVGKNSFNFERAYLTAKEKLSDRTSVRVTTDVFTNGTSGYGVRLKYGYLQYDYLKNADVSAVARVGMLHTVYIDHEENFWPRWLAKTPTELAGYFASADLGAATLITLPSKMGEVYAVVSNGPGYTTVADPDRFKDYQARLTLTPFSSTSGILKTFDLSGWYYKGATADSNMTATSPTARRMITGKALQRDRWGLFAGVRDPRLTVGLDWAQRTDETEGDTVVNTPSVTSKTGRVLSAYTVVHPLAMPLGVVVRYDQVKPNTSNSQDYTVFIGGLTYDLSKRASISADYQEADAHNGAAATSGGLPTPRAAYMHVVVNY